jgi:phage-related protein
MWVIETIPVIIESITQFFAELPTRISETVASVLSAISLWGMNLAAWVALNIPIVIGSIASFFASLPGKITNAISGVISAIGTWAGNLITKAGEELPKVVASIVEYFKALPKEILQVGKDLVTGLWNGMNGMMSWIKKKIKEFASSLISSIKSSLGISSPSKVMADEVGKWIPAGIARGITGNAGLVQAAMDTMSTQLTAGGSLEVEGSVPKGRATAEGDSALQGNRSTNLTFNVQSFSQARHEIDLLNKQLASATGL